MSRPTLEISIFVKWRQEDREFKLSLSYIVSVRLWLKKTN